MVPIMKLFENDLTVFLTFLFLPGDSLVAQYECSNSYVLVFYFSNLDVQMHEY